MLLLIGTPCYSLIRSKVHKFTKAKFILHTLETLNYKKNVMKYYLLAFSTPYVLLGLIKGHHPFWHAADQFSTCFVELVSQFPLTCTNLPEVCLWLMSSCLLICVWRRSLAGVSMGFMSENLICKGESRDLRLRVRTWMWKNPCESAMLSKAQHATISVSVFCSIVNSPKPTSAMKIKELIPFSNKATNAPCHIFKACEAVYWVMWD